MGGVTDSMTDDSTIKQRQKTGVAILYFIFAGFAVLCLGFLHVYVPETRGKTAEELNSMENPLLANSSSSQHGLLTKSLKGEDDA